jgi:DNA-directed RNA polymerase specialized sigma24 family protein
MTKVARHALLPSLLASALAGPAVAEPSAPAPQPAAKRAHGTPTPVRCPACDQQHNDTSRAARSLLVDASLTEATRKSARSLLGADIEDAEEAAQEAALRAVTKNLRACCRHGLQRWMFRTAKNYLLDRYRKKRETLLSTMNDSQPGGDWPSPMSANPDIGPLQILALRDEVETALTRHDLGSMSPDKKVQLGRALGDRLQSDKSIRTYLPKAAVLVDGARQAVLELTPRS